MLQPKNDEEEKPALLNRNLKKIVFFVAALFCLTPFVSPTLALLLGLSIALFVGHPFLSINNKVTQILLKVSVVGLGFGMNVHSALKAGKEGVLFTVVSIAATLVFGYFFGKILNVEKKTAYLISAGTAICGGSAIAAISPVIRAEEKHISVALGAVFILNSFALILFPFVGYKLHLSQTQFGLWCAIAIHDTSSVVGAASKYGAEALEMAVTIKLARALWIIPLAFLSTFLFKNKSSKVKVPYFIGFFIIAMVINSYIPFVQEHGHYVVSVAKAGLTLTLFLIGCGLSKKVLQSVGVMALLQALILWILISITTLWAVTSLTV